MIDALPSLKAATGISGNDILAYLAAEGWVSKPSKVEGVFVVSKEIPETRERAELIIPIKAGQSDEQRRVADALRALAQIDGFTEEEIAERVLRATVQRLSPSKLAAVEVEKPGTIKKIQTKRKSAGSIVFEYIENVAQQLRNVLGIPDQDVFNIVDVLENDLPKVLVDFRIEVTREALLEIYSTSVPPRIVLKKSVYDSARTGDAKARFIIAHELGHLMLHQETRYYSYKRGNHESRRDNQESKRIQAVETEAQRFALAFLMPVSVARGFNDPKLLSLYCKVDQKVAEMRMRDVALSPSAAKSSNTPKG